MVVLPAVTAFRFVQIFSTPDIVLISVFPSSHLPTYCRSLATFIIINDGK